MKWVSIIILCMLMGTSITAQKVQAIEDFVEAHSEPEFDKYFVYQSYLRMLNKDGNDDFNKLIKDVDKIIAYIAQGNSTVTKEDYKGLIQSLGNDEFEILIKAKYEDALINVMAQISGDNSKYVVAVHSDKDFALLEMVGELDLKYINAFKTIDVAQLGEFILSQEGEAVEGAEEENEVEENEDDQ